jgi:uncharacterized protein YejL (UPF0352 family)
MRLPWSLCVAKIMFCYKHGAPQELSLMKLGQLGVIAFKENYFVCDITASATPAKLRLIALPHRGIVFIENSHLNCIAAPAGPREFIVSLINPFKRKHFSLCLRKNEAPMEPDYFGNT